GTQCFDRKSSMLVPAVYAVLIKMNLYLWESIIFARGGTTRTPARCWLVLASPNNASYIQTSRMISLQKHFLFVHIPKTAGNSIQTALRDYSEDQLVALRKEQDGIERFGLRNPKYNIKKHSTLAEYRDALENEQF